LNDTIFWHLNWSYGTLRGFQKAGIGPIKPGARKELITFESGTKEQYVGSRSIMMIP